MEAVNVFVRVRGGHRRRPAESSVEVRAGSHGRPVISVDGQRDFHFDTAGGEKTTQAHMYAVAGRPTLATFLDGYNGAILCYGQSGAGKTHTMIGGEGEARGLVPRILEEAFGELTRKPGL